MSTDYGVIFGIKTTYGKPETIKSKVPLTISDKYIYDVDGNQLFHDKEITNWPIFINGLKIANNSEELSEKLYDLSESDKYEEFLKERQMDFIFGDYNHILGLSSYGDVFSIKELKELTPIIKKLMREEFLIGIIEEDLVVGIIVY